MRRLFRFMQGRVCRSLPVGVAAIVLLAASQSRGADWWVSQNGSGSQSGADSNDCQAIAWVSACTGNGAVNWGNGPGQITAGDTIHLVGTISNMLNLMGSGTPGNPITIHFEPGARFSAPTMPINNRWILAQGIGVSNIVIDGGANGVMELTDNGTVAANGGTMDYGNFQIAGISVTGANVTIENLTISNLYQRQTNSERQRGNSDATGLFWAGNNLLVSNCNFSAVQDGIFVTMGGAVSSNLLIINCLFTNFNHGITIGCGNGGPLPYFNNIKITHCQLFTGDMFESVNTPGFNCSFTNGTNNLIVTAAASVLAPPGSPGFWQGATNLLAPFGWNPGQTWTNSSMNMVAGCYTNSQGQAIAVDASGNMYAGQLPLDLTPGLFTNMWFKWPVSQGAWISYWQPPDLLFHRNPIFIFDDAPGGCISNIEISYDYIQAGWHPRSYTAGTGAMYMEFSSNGMANHVRVFNNISVTASNTAYSGGGGLCAAGGTDVLVANNTLIAGAGAGNMSVCGTNACLYNNILVAGNGEFLGTWVANTAGYTNNLQTMAMFLSGVHSDHNIFNNQTANAFDEIIYSDIPGTSIPTLWAGGWVYDTLAQFTNTFPPSAGFDFDSHSLTNLVQYDSNFVPLIGSVAANNGTNLTAWGITDDYAGNPRPATGNWTIGAYQIMSGGSNVNTNGPSSGGGAGGSSGTAGITGGGGGGSVTTTTVTGGGGASRGVVAAGVSNFVAGGAGPDVTNGLLIHYQFNQISGTSVADASGSHHTGSLQGKARWTNGLPGTAAVFFAGNDGAYGSYDGVSTPSLSYAGDWTVTFWVYNSSFPGAANYAVSTAGGTGILLGPSWCGMYDGTNSLTGPALGAGSWYFIALSKSSGTNYQLYVNGTASTSGVLANVNISSLNIGHRETPDFGMIGCVADFRIFNRVLSAGEVSTLSGNGPDDVAAAIPTNLHVVTPGH